jgi:hypothetical protein
MPAQGRQLRANPSFVIAGLDPAIQSNTLSAAAPWMPVSGAGMT